MISANYTLKYDRGRRQERWTALGPEGRIGDYQFRFRAMVAMQEDAARRGLLLDWSGVLERLLVVGPEDPPCQPDQLEVLDVRRFDGGGFHLDAGMTGGAPDEPGAFFAVASYVVRPGRRPCWSASVVWRFEGPTTDALTQAAEQLAVDTAKADPAVQQALKRARENAQ